VALNVSDGGALVPSNAGRFGTPNLNPNAGEEGPYCGTVGRYVDAVMWYVGVEGTYLCQDNLDLSTRALMVVTASETARSVAVVTTLNNLTIDVTYGKYFRNCFCKIF